MDRKAPFVAEESSSREQGTARRVKMHRMGSWLRASSLGLILLGTGCTPLKEYVQNGCKVGPNYQRPPAPLADSWIDAKDPKVKSVPADYSVWWTVFGDPVLNDLVKVAYEQNVNLKIAGTRVLEARAQRAIAVGSLFPQQQAASGSFTHVGSSGNVANPLPNHYFDNWAGGFNASWELDFWGRFRRTIESTDDLVDSTVDDYDAVMVSLIGDVASAYVQYRNFEQELVYTRVSIAEQQLNLKKAESRFKAGQTNKLPVLQAQSLLAQTEALVSTLEIGQRNANNQLCVLLGMPPADLADWLGKASIPRSPGKVVVGIPADLIRRRPDLRSAERQIAAQNAQIGVAEADFYPAFFINGSIGVEAKDVAKLFASKSMSAQVGPAFQWNILNYGRILNNVRAQDFKTQELVGVYQQKVLSAGQEVENGIDSFLRSQEQVKYLTASVEYAEQAVKIAVEDFDAGLSNFTAVFVAEQFLVQQRNALAQAQGDVALSLINVYRSLGGGWELRLGEQATQAVTQPGDPGMPVKSESGMVSKPAEERMP
jgi:NodT family efflux transporter outer membrane factor (OMF) lipoprotein